MNINEKKLEAVEFVKKNFNEMYGSEGHSESILPIGNNVVLQFVWGNNMFQIHIYDHQYHNFICSGYTQDELNKCIPIVENAVDHFYINYIWNCRLNRKPITIPGCDNLYFDEKIEEYYYLEDPSTKYAKMSNKKRGYVLLDDFEYVAYKQGKIWVPEGWWNENK